MPEEQENTPYFAKKTEDGIFVITDESNLQSVVVEEDVAVKIAVEIIHQSWMGKQIADSLEG